MPKYKKLIEALRSIIPWVLGFSMAWFNKFFIYGLILAVIWVLLDQFYFKPYLKKPKE
jgi:membrane protein DedA with SNARE-associated domain